MTSKKVTVDIRGTELASIVDAARAKNVEQKRLTAELDPLKSIIRDKGLEVLIEQDGSTKSVEFTTEAGSAVVTVPDETIEVNQAEAENLKKLLGDSYASVVETKITIKDKDKLEAILASKNGAAKIVADKALIKKASTPRVTLK